ncbi:ogr/Delta-like zinc finger family protein [Pantoea sp. FN0307]|uniref:ogr/Delta-like zinc finger family protein n=1 Tax=unclassified Pantoea TaxID=2630326 RepID=UPI003CF7B556
MRVMRIECPACGEKSIIKKTVRHHRELSDLYCACTDYECGHTFVMNVTFSHTISPSAKNKDDMLKSLVSNIDNDDRQKLMELLKKQA